MITQNMKKMMDGYSLFFIGVLLFFGFLTADRFFFVTLILYAGVLLFTKLDTISSIVLTNAVIVVSLAFLN